MRLVLRHATLFATVLLVTTTTTANAQAVEAQARCTERCGRTGRRFFRKYTMCAPNGVDEVCTSRSRRQQRRGYTCGACPEPPQALVCPAPGESMTIESYQELTSILLPLHDSEDMPALCTLWLVSRDNEELQVPIARSYHNHKWEAYSGHYAGLRIDCRGTSGCRTRLPVVPIALRARYGNYKYVLRSYNHVLSEKDEHARFLEQTTFGPTRTEMSSMPGSYADWIETQVAVPYSSHRRMYRRYLNHRHRKPSYQGEVTHACKEGTRYRRYAFSDKDLNQYVNITTDEENGRKIFSLDSHIRTFVEATNLTCGDPSHGVFYEDGLYRICWIYEQFVGGRFRLWHDGRGCDDLHYDGEERGLPAVQFDDLTPPTNPMVNLDGYAMEVDGQYYAAYGGSSQELYVFADLDENEPACVDAPALTGNPIYGVVGLFNGSYWIHDPRFRVYENTLEQPRLDSLSPLVNATLGNEYGYDVRCSRAQMNFLNEEHCQLSTTADACGETVSYGEQSFELTEETFERLFDAGPRYVYPVIGLRQEGAATVPYDPPCTPEARSRWIPVDDCSSDDDLGNYTEFVLAELLSNSPDTNPYVRDITFPAFGYSCSQNDTELYSMKIMDADGQCWENVHVSHYQVYDFTRWVRAHPGGPAAIKQFAEVSENFTLTFPHWHEMSRWYDNVETFLTEVGRYGDDVTVTGASDLELVFENLLVSEQVAGAVVVCGSPDEVANEPDLYGSLYRGAFDATTLYELTSSLFAHQQQREAIWLDIALYGDDQLRQRVAWILSQILVISPDSIVYWYQTERFLVYYDIFVRHAFGNYRDILKEVSYSGMMAEMLSYLGSQSTAYVWQRFKRIEFADENFAREVMQLFSIGLYHLNDDGTRQKDNFGNDRITYINEDIAEYARMWTGFYYAPTRGNVEERSRWGNAVDPMTLNYLTRDVYPKMGLDRKYVGDGMPLCRDLPSQHFLRPGASYRLLGSIPSPTLIRQRATWATNPDIRRLILSKESALYNKLCDAPDVNSTCTFPSKVTLKETIPCNGAECDIESPRVIEVESGLYYEYTRQACVEQGFYENPRLTQTRWYQFSCSDPHLSVGSLTCCDGGNNRGTFGSEEFDGEFMSFFTAEARCAAKGMNLCTRHWGTCDDCDTYDGYWTNQPCYIMTKINLEGKIAIVHNSTDQYVEEEHIVHNVRQDTKTFFRVDWTGPIEEFLGDYENQCEEMGCSRDSYDNLCLCPTMVSNTPAFTSTPSREAILSTLKIGAFPPHQTDGMALSRRASSREVRVYSKGREGRTLSVDTVFMVEDDFGVTRYFKNEKSQVSVGVGGSLDLSFRNPPHFISLNYPEIRDGYYETDAGLDHYFYHRNTAPFLSLRFAQRFGLSNPSPRLLTIASQAFRRGEYVDPSSGKSFGSGTYGDLLALVSAILLDRESRDVVLDADPSQGSMLEPFLKFVRVMRSLEFEPDKDKPWIEFSRGMQDAIGQQTHKIPNVFSFFLPEFTPAGSVGDAMMVCPECQVLTGPRSIALMNGMYSLLKYGLDAAYGGLGVGRGGWHGHRRVGQSTYATGVNTYQPDDAAPTAEIVDELSTLLTSGRLDRSKRSQLVDIYDGIMNQTASATQAIIFVEQLIVSTPDFHSNGLSQNDGQIIPESPPPQSSGTPYKAVIYILLNGGYDSYNTLVPHTCEGTNAAGATSREQYDSERGELAFTDSERTLIINAENQPCSQFALHDELTIVKELYDDGDLVFFANAGVIDESGVTKTDYYARTNVQLFAHNAMQKESQTVDPDKKAPGTGVLGRLASLLQVKGFETSSATIDNPSFSLVPEAGSDPSPLIVSRYGVSSFDDIPTTETYSTREYIERLNAKPSGLSSMFGKTWSEQLVTGIRQGDDLKTVLDETELGDHWPTSGWTYQAQRAAMISRLIQTREGRGKDRDFFFTEFGGWDHHSALKDNLRPRHNELNGALSYLVEELKTQGVWDDVAIVVASEFARTITGNSGVGSDHGWGGHYFMMGGKVKGGQIVGDYPDDITDEGPLNIGRGRIIPTMSWDVVLNSVAEWMGADGDAELDYCLPNRHGSTGNGFADLLNEGDLFN